MSTAPACAGCSASATPAGSLRPAWYAARATAAAIRAAGADEVCFVITGEWVDRDGDEDVACADYIEALLRGEPAPAEDFARRVRDSDFGRRFVAGTWPTCRGPTWSLPPTWTASILRCR